MIIVKISTLHFKAITKILIGIIIDLYIDNLLHQGLVATGKIYYKLLSFSVFVFFVSHYISIYSHLHTNIKFTLFKWLLIYIIYFTTKGKNQLHLLHHLLIGKVVLGWWKIGVILINRYEWWACYLHSRLT